MTTCVKTFYQGFLGQQLAISVLATVWIRLKCVTALRTAPVHSLNLVSRCVISYLFHIGRDRHQYSCRHIQNPCNTTRVRCEPGNVGRKRAKNLNCNSKLHELFLRYCRTHGNGVRWNEAVFILLLIEFLTRSLFSSSFDARRLLNGVLRFARDKSSFAADGQKLGGERVLLSR